MNLSTLNAFDWGTVLNNCGLWLADWSVSPNNTIPTTYTYVMQQYSDGPNYDHDEFFGSIDQWKAYGYHASNANPTPPQSTEPTAAAPETVTPPQTTSQPPTPTPSDPQETQSSSETTPIISNPTPTPQSPAIKPEQNKNILKKVWGILVTFFHKLFRHEN